MRHNYILGTILLAMALTTAFPLQGQRRTNHKKVVMSAQTKKAASPFTKFTLASWNIGHFALGKHGDTQLTFEEAPQKMLEYRAFLNSVGADMVAVLEYSPDFVHASDGKPAISAREAVFGNYAESQIGKKYSYNCNCLFSNGFKVLGSEEKWYSVMVQKRYYQVTNILMGRDTVKVVATHLDWNQGENGKAYRSQQIQELIKAFKNQKYVIFCADWNAKASEYDAFLQAGYKMANHGLMGDLLSYPAGNDPQSPYDNIIAKGFAINNVQLFNRPELTDHMMIKASLTKLQ